MRITCLLILGFALALVAADIPEEATITRIDGSTLTGKVVRENLDEVVFLLGDGAAAAETALPRSKVKKVTYGPVQDADFSRAMGARNAGQSDRAAAGFLKAAQATVYTRVRELAYLEAARSLADAKKPDEALKALQDLEAAAKRSVLLPRAFQLRADILLAKGDAAGAEAAAKELAQYDPLSAAMVRAGLRRSAGKHADAAAELEAVFGKTLTETTEVAEGQPTYAAVGFQLAEDFDKAGNAEAAAAILDTLCYAGIGKDEQARAHMAMAERLSTKTDKASLIAAFDHAMMAVALSRTQRNAVRKVTKSILEQFDKDASMKDEVAEYRGYLNAL